MLSRTEVICLFVALPLHKYTETKKIIRSARHLRFNSIQLKKKNFIN